MSEKPQFRPGSKASLFLELATPDSEGFSRKVKVRRFVGKYETLKMGNGGSWCRDDGSLAKHYNVVRHKEGGKITAVELHGYKKAPIEKPIPAEIRQELKDKPCAVLAISKVEIDHRDGRRDDPRLGDPKRLKLSDFQPLSKAVNLAKRQHCKRCRQTNKRFDARLLGYSAAQWKGNGIYRGSCIGCYWHDPQRFNREVSASYKREK